MTDIRDHRSSVPPQRVNGKLPIRPVNYLQVTAPRHGRRATLRSAVPARLPSAAARARQVSRVTAVAENLLICLGSSAPI
jgi:hypothetical protein